MSLRWKVVLLLCGVFVVLLGMIRLIDDSIVVPSFTRLERDEAATDLSRCVRALESEIDQLDALCREWADSYWQTSDDPVVCFERPFSPDVMQNERLGVLIIRDADGGTIWSGARPPDDADDENSESAFESGVTAGHPLLCEWDASLSLKGVVAVGSRVLLASSRPIIDPDGLLAPAGRVIVGRWLDTRCRERIVDRTRVELDIWLVRPGERVTVGLDGRPLPPAALAALDQLADATRVYFDDRDRETLHTYCKQLDLTGEPLLLLRARVERYIIAAGATARDFLLSALVSLLVIILVLVWMQLEIMVVKPVKQLRDHVTRIGRDGNLELRIERPRHDEIGDLCNSFNEMAGSLSSYRQRLVDVAHRSGMSDTATNILHNVGNVLNSVVVSTDMLTAQVSESRIKGLTQAAALLDVHKSDLGTFLARDSRGQKLPEYLVRLAELLAAEQQAIADEVRSLQEKVQHIRDVIATQQALACGPRLISSERLDALVAEVSSLQEAALRRRSIELRQEFGPLPPVRVSRPKFIQVLENLLQNAADAITEQGGEERRITLRGGVDEQGRVTLVVEDTGVGFDPNLSEQIFCCGYTTKPNGHGFGLHYCANALTEMGARISASSAGRGRGAAFKLTLTAAPEAVPIPGSEADRAGASATVPASDDKDHTASVGFQDSGAGGGR